MASYPGSVKTFTTKIDGAGNTIFAAHVNDLQSEVTAIEDGILNGTAPLNSSNSTLAALSVSGGSTLVSLHVTGNVTVDGALTQTGGGRVLLTNSARHQIPNAAFTALNWDTEIADVSGMHSTSVNSSRITFTPSSGLWLVGANVEWDTSTGLVRIVRIVHNGSTVIVDAIADRLQTANNAGQSVSAMMNVNSTADFLTVEVFQNSGSTGSLSSGLPVSFWASKQ